MCDRCQTISSPCIHVHKSAVLIHRKRPFNEICGVSTVYLAFVPSEWMVVMEDLFLTHSSCHLQVVYYGAGTHMLSRYGTVRLNFSCGYACLWVHWMLCNAGWYNLIAVSALGTWMLDDFEDICVCARWGVDGGRTERWTVDVRTRVVFGCLTRDTLFPV